MSHYRFRKKNQNIDAILNWNIVASLKNPKMTGEPFACTATWITANLPPVGTVTLADSLQRHNYYYNSNFSQEKAYQKSIEAGDSWIAINRNPIDLLKNHGAQFHRWDFWQSHPYFQETKYSLNSALEQQEVFQTAIKTDAVKFWRNHLDDNKLLATKAYIIEELAVTICILMNSENPTTIIYPGPELKSFSAAREGKITGIPDAMTRMHWFQYNVTAR